MRIENPIPITIVSGFLGAGKTSLMTHILTSDHGKRMAVLVNDFGKLNIDAEQISTIEGETISLTNGCICCTIRDDLLTEVLKLFEKKIFPEHILIETSGISDPTLVAHTFLMPAVQGVVQVDSIISVIDAEQFLDLDPQFLDLARRQIKVADLLVINKIDLVNKPKLDKVKNNIKRISQEAHILETVNGRGPLHLLLGASTFDPTKMDNMDDVTDLAFESWIYQSDGQFTFMAIRKSLEQIPRGVYRIKGFVHLEAVPNKGIFQMTGGRAWLRLGDYWQPEVRKTRLVFIGEKSKVDPVAINANFDRCQYEYNRGNLEKSAPVKVENMKALSIVFG